MEFRQLRYFLAVAQNGGFTRAAQRLNMAQPPLSRQIAALEHELGTQLFDRMPQGVRLTKSGEALLAEAGELIDRWQQVRDRIRAAAAPTPDEIVLGFVSAAAYSLLPNLVRAWTAKGGRLKIDTATNGGDPLKRLVDGTLDAALLWLPVSPQGLAALPLQRERLHVAIPKGHRLATQNVVQGRDLGNDTLILGCRTATVEKRILRLVSTEPGRAPAYVRVPDLNTAIDQVAIGLGYSVVPESVRPDRGDNVVYRALAPAASLQLGLVYKVGAARRVHRFAEFTRAHAAALDVTAPEYPAEAHIADRPGNRHRPAHRH